MILRKGLGSLRSPHRALIASILKELKKFFGNRLISLIVLGNSNDINTDLLIIVKDLPANRAKRLLIINDIEKKISFLIDKFFEKYEDYLISITPIIKDLNEVKDNLELYIDVAGEVTIVYDKDSTFEKLVKELRTSTKEYFYEHVHWSIEAEEVIAASY